MWVVVRGGLGRDWSVSCVPGYVSVSLILRDQGMSECVSIHLSPLCIKDSGSWAPSRSHFPSAGGGPLGLGGLYPTSLACRGQDPREVLTPQSTCRPEPPLGPLVVGVVQCPPGCPSPCCLLASPISVQCVIFYDRSYIRHNQIYGSCIL